MVTYTVHKICQVGTRQMLLVQGAADSVQLCIYCEHTGQTLLRLTDCSLAAFKEAIALLEA